MGNKIPKKQQSLPSQTSHEQALPTYDLYTFRDNYDKKEMLHRELVKSKATRSILYSRTNPKPRIDDSLESLVVQPIKALNLVTLSVHMHGMVIDNSELIPVPFDFLFRWIQASPHDANRTRE
jgi:hypothetical protein